MRVLHERHNEEAEEYIASSSDQLSRIRSSDCTRTHLRGPRIPKKFGGGGACPQTPLDGVRVIVLYSRYLSPPPPNNSTATAGKSPITLVPYIGSTCSLNFARHQIIGEKKRLVFVGAQGGEPENEVTQEAAWKGGAFSPNKN